MRTRWTRAFALATLGLGGIALPPQAAETAAGLRHFRFIKPVVAMSSAREELAAAVFDADVYTHAAAGFADLRLVDQDGALVPFLIEKQQHTKVVVATEPVSVTVESLTEKEGNRIEVVVSLARDAEPATGIEIVTPLRDFEKHVTVFGSRADSATWKELVRDQPIFDYSRFMDVRSTRIELPDNDCTAYRVEFGNVSDLRTSTFMEMTRTVQGAEPTTETGRHIIERRDFRIDRLEFSRRRRREGERVDADVAWAVADIEFPPHPERGQSAILVRTARQPLTAFRFVTGNRNFSRAVTVQIPRNGPGTTAWVDLAVGAIREISFRDVRRRELTIEFPETRAALYRVLVHNGDSPPLEFTGIEGIGRAYQALFLAYPEKQYRLVFGDDRARPPVFDAAVLHILRQAKGREVLTLELEPLFENPESGKPLGLLALFENRWFLSGVIAIVVAALAWGIVSALRHVDAATVAGEE